MSALRFASVSACFVSVHHVSCCSVLFCLTDYCLCVVYVLIAVFLAYCLLKFMFLFECILLLLCACFCLCCFSVSGLLFSVLFCLTVYCF